MSAPGVEMVGESPSPEHATTTRVRAAASTQKRLAGIQAVGWSEPIFNASQLAGLENQLTAARDECRHANQLARFDNSVYLGADALQSLGGHADLMWQGAE